MLPHVSVVPNCFLVVHHYRIYHSLFIHSPAEGHLHFKFLEIMSNVTTNTRIQVFVWTQVFISLGKYLGVILLGHKVSVCLTLWEMAQLFSKGAVSFCIATSKVWRFQLLHILTSIWHRQFWVGGGGNGFAVFVVCKYFKLQNTYSL